jgi:DNA-binding MarR family transcriptional regulator
MTALIDVFSQLVRLEIELWNAADARLRADLGLPLSRYEPMRVIDSHESCRVNTIATELVITVGGASKLVDRIEASGHCKRQRDPSDGRSSIIKLTPSGKRLLTKATHALEAELSVRLAALSPTALTQLSSHISKLREDVARCPSRRKGRTALP